MKFILGGILIILLTLLMSVMYKFNELKNIKYNQPQILSNKKILTIYYSNGENTKNVAQNLHSIVGGDIIEVQLLEKYPKNILKMSKLVRKQIKEGDFPKIEDIDISNYDVIFIGSPIWNFSISLPMKTFLKNNNFENKTLIPFFTYSGGVNKNKVNKDIITLTRAKDTRQPLFIFENGIILVKEQIINWLNRI